MSKEVTKYVIEIPDDISFNPQFLTLYGVEPKGDYVRTYDIEMDEAEELTADYINEHFGDLQDTAYQRGLYEGNDIGYKDGVNDGRNEAWEAARKIVCDEGIDMNTLCTIFGRGFSSIILRDYSASEAIAKLKAYKEKQKADDKIEVGDTVSIKNISWSDGDGIVTKVRNNQLYIMWNDGSYGTWNKEYVVKTGRHFDIDKILEEMRND